MAIVQNPLIGRASGSFSNVTFLTRYGKNIIKSKSLGSNLPPSASQLSQRNKFGNAVAFYKKNQAFLNFFLSAMVTNMSAFNKFIALNIAIFSTVANTALTTAATGLKFAIGDLDVIVPGAISVSTGLHITVGGTITTNPVKSKATDSISIIMFNRTTSMLAKIDILRSAWVVANVIVCPFAAGTVCDVFLMTHDGVLINHSSSVFVGTVTILA